MTPEEIKTQLQQFANPNGLEEMKLRLRELPGELSETGIGFLEGITRRVSNADLERVRVERRRAFLKLSTEDRVKVFGAFFPSIAEHVEASWQLQLKLPYLTGHLRKAFRAPSNPAYTSSTRITWLEELLRATLPYRYDLEFLTVWAPHLQFGMAERCIGLLLAGALDSSGSQSTYETLIAIVNGQHETGRIGRYAVMALLSCSRPEGWETVERLLLAAQRQEGLRQVVLECVDFAHREAFLRMLRLIDRERLSRFTAVARAAAVWFGQSVDSADAKLVDGLIQETRENFEDAALRDHRVRTARGQSLYLALWARAFDDAHAATPDAAAILTDADFERRYAAVHLLSQLWSIEANRQLRQCLADPDLRVALKAAEVIPREHSKRQLTDYGDDFPALEGLLARTPEDKLLDPAIWEWNRIHANRSELTIKLIGHRGERPFTDLAKHLPEMDAAVRQHFLRVMKDAAAARKELLPGERDIALALLSDASNGVREEAFEILGEASVSAAEAEAMEPLLARKASDLRRGVIRLLLKQTPEDCRASIDRLASSRDELMRKAAEELRSEIEPKSEPAATLDDGLGLYSPAERTQPVAPNGSIAVDLSSAETERLLRSLDSWIDHHRETSIAQALQPGQTIERLFGNARYLNPKRDFPLREVWAEWWQSAEASEGLSRPMAKLALLPYGVEHDWQKQALAGLSAAVDLKFPDLCRAVLWHLLLGEHAAADVDFLLDVLETYIQRLTAWYKPEPKPKHGWSPGWKTGQFHLLLRLIESCREVKPEIWADAMWRRYWNLCRWVDEGIAGEPRMRPALETLLAARRRGVATDADLFEQLLGANQFMGYGHTALSVITARKPAKLMEPYPELADFARRCRERILEIELKRGDLPTPASIGALSLRSVYGADLALRLLKLQGQEPLSRGYLRDNESKTVVFSHLLRVCLPSEQDTPESFTAAAKKLGIARNRLIDFGVYAPQWTRHVEHATGIEGFTDAAFWLHAHTKDTQWTVDAEIRELWFAEVSERTPLTREELLDGAVDVDWLRQVSSKLSKTDWALTLDSAKYASGGSGHKRAELFASAIAGEIKTAELGKRIAEKRSQDAVRALGLVPLPAQEEPRKREVLRRYETVQKFLRETRKFGPQRQASEKLAASIGLANMARTAGYPDPLRLSWAMEAEASADLREGPVEATDGEVRAVLSIDALGDPQLAYEKNGKPLKDVPAALRKSPALSALRARKTELTQQTSRMRQSLEESMIRGDRFTPQELCELEAHPLLKPMIGSLLFACDDGSVRWRGELNGGALRFAHPVDLLKAGTWPQLQRQCIEAERTQPFKQAFRELYVLTETERAQQTYSSRYEGQQVNPKQATAVIGKRGWVNVPEEGLRKTFHHDNVSVWVTFLEGWFTPADVDGLTVQRVIFSNRSDGKTIPLDQLNGRVFSEAMRDLDLMVSVAHRGEVDPEATASTVEMRTALLRETLSLLKLRNVRLQDRHAFVDGKLGDYNIHLGSGVVHRQPGGSLCIIPVHSQHRGRLFLPFADNDPKTAEIVSKVLLLAQDEQIKDPTILEQIR